MNTYLKDRKTIIDLIGATCLFILFLPACVGQATSQQYPVSLPITSRPSETEVIVVSEASYYQSRDTYKEIIEKVDIIVIGKADDTGWTFNEARNADNPSKPADTLYGLARIYEIQVDRYLKGEGPKSFYTFIVVGDAFGRTAEEVQEKVAKGELSPVDSAMLPDTPSLMFLGRFDADTILPEVPKGDYYIRQTDPWLFDISDPDQIQSVNAHAPNPQLDRTLPLEKLITNIENPELIPPTPTPVVEPDEPRPYPSP